MMENESTNESFNHFGKLTGKSAIVTGGETPLGLLIAQAMVQEGARVLLSCFNELEEAYVFNPEERSEASKIIWSSGDIRRLDYCKTMAMLANQVFGRLDAIIDNSDFEFQQIWPGSQVLPDDEAYQPSSGSRVTDNFYRSVIGNMPSGGTIIHIASQPSPHPISWYPSFSSPIYDEKNLEKVLCEQGLRVITLPHEQVSGLSLLNQFPANISEQQANQLYELSQSIISILTKE